MILILSTQDDKSTTEVQFWLKYYNLKSLRISDKDELDIKEISIESGTGSIIEVKLNYGGQIITLSLSGIDKYWYRRGVFNVKYNTFQESKKVDAITTLSLNRVLQLERNSIITLLNFHFKFQHSISSFDDNSLNKLTVLQVASSLGFKIPPTLITTDKQALAKFNHLNRSIITKAIWNGCVFKFGEVEYNWPTLLFDFDKLESSIPLKFPPTLFQKNISKKYELRIFYLNEKMYASCIFSQSDSQTKIDFREYNREHPNRVVSYELPDEISKKIIELMKIFKLNSGSIDMIYGVDNEYYFLEINPIGQFEQVSYPCNYYLERAIARYFRATYKTQL